MVKCTHLVGLNFIDHKSAQCSSLLMSFCKIKQSFSELITLYIRTSSAYSLIVLFTEVVMSLMYSRNSSGASTVPCGTPEVTVCGLLDIPSSTTD